jgi:hypothetical protein
MKTDANPLCEIGERNALCPYYEGCLDHAVQCRWPFWDCSFCPHKSKTQALADPPMVKDPDPEYPIVAGHVSQIALP